MPLNSAMGAGRRDFGYVAWGVICLVIALVGFWPSYVAPLAAGSYRPPSPTMTWHVIFTTAWLILLILQPLLVRQNMIALHRQLGVLGVLVAIGVVVTGIVVQLDVLGPYAAKDDYANAVPIPFIRLTLLLGFAICITWAVLLRSRPDWHKRLMLLGTLPLFQSAFDRMGANVFGLPEIRGLFAIGGFLGLLLLFVIWDRIRLGHFHPVTKWVTIAFAVFYVFSPAIAGSPWWRAIAASLAKQ